MSRDNDAAPGGALDDVAPGDSPGVNPGQEGQGGMVPPAPDQPGAPTQQPGVPAGPSETTGQAPGPGVGEGRVGEAPGRTTTRGGASGPSGPSGAGDGGWWTRILRIFGIR